MTDFPTEADVIRKNIEDIENQRSDLQAQIADLTFMLKKLNDKLDKLEKGEKHGKEH